MFPIRLGDRGDPVADVQRRLSALGHSVGPSGVDGVFADETEKAVSRFQTERGLSETGIVDEKTWRALVEATIKLGDRLLYLRSPFFHGDDVRELQQRLNTLGFNCGKLDGVFGRMTERAVRDFQTNTGLPADGIAGEATLHAMGKLKIILETKSATSLPRKRPRPFSSSAVFRQRVVAMVTSGQRDEGMGEANCDELAGRLENLLELLGARVRPVQADDETGLLEQADVIVTFALDEPGAGSGFRVEAVGKESSGLAEAIYAQLAASVTEMPDRGLEVSGGSGRTASVVVRPGARDSAHDLNLLADEAFAQKIAVAVFDGLHEYFQAGARA